MSTAVATSLIEKLREIQTREGLSDYKFADKLGVSHQLWQMTRTDKREIGLTILQGTLRAYPELSREVLLFLSIDVVKDTGFAGDTTTPSETSSDKHQGGLLSRLISHIKQLFGGARKC